MPRNVDVNSVFKPLSQDAAPIDIRRQQADTAILVGQVVANMRGTMQARLEAEANAPRSDRPRFDAAELEKELAALEARLAMCRVNLEKTAKNPGGKLRFLQLGEKRAAALIEALENLRQRS